ncbi:MAG TPA: nucleotidyl transferase AbiEii/AbiGii toxin family protein [Bacteroidales bacterium]|nr:nucleotidyl transferase AbiEii/AbiGii toxin family protein [Bacteroidales bacterium]
MLQYQSIEPKVLELLKTLQSFPLLSDMRLAGGTGLALQIGHRKSTDIDLFGNLNADPAELDIMLSTFQDVKLLHRSQNIHVFAINKIKTDFVNYPYHWLENSLNENGVRLAGEKDIAAMKLAAITGRGSKKDFIDIYFLLKKFSLRDLFGFYEEKFPDGSRFLVTKSLIYFNDAEEDVMPDMLKDVEWSHVKSEITQLLLTESL